MSAPVLTKWSFAIRGLREWERNEEPRHVWIAVHVKPAFAFKELHADRRIPTVLDRYPRVTCSGPTREAFNKPSMVTLISRGAALELVRGSIAFDIEYVERGAES